MIYKRVMFRSNVVNYQKVDLMLEIWIYTNQLKGSKMLQGIRDFHVSIFERAFFWTNRHVCQTWPGQRPEDLVMFYWYRGEHLVCRVINVFIFKDIIKALIRFAEYLAAQAIPAVGRLRSSGIRAGHGTGFNVLVPLHRSTSPFRTGMLISNGRDASWRPSPRFWQPMGCVCRRHCHTQ